MQTGHGFVLVVHNELTVVDSTADADQRDDSRAAETVPSPQGRGSIAEEAFDFAPNFGSTSRGSDPPQDPPPDGPEEPPLDDSDASIHSADLGV